MSDDFDLDDLDLDTDDDAQRTTTIRTDQLRALRKAAKQAKRVTELEAQVKRYERRDTVRSMPGLDGLNADQVAAVSALVGDDAEPDAYLAKARSLGFVTEPEPADTADADAAANDRIARASEGSNRPDKGELTPDEVGEWAPDRLLAFRDAHPDLADALLQGESVTRPTGF